MKNKLIFGMLMLLGFALALDVQMKCSDSGCLGIYEFKKNGDIRMTDTQFQDVQGWGWVKMHIMLLGKDNEIKVDSISMDYVKNDKSLLFRNSIRKNYREGDTLVVILVPKKPIKLNSNAKIRLYEYGAGNSASASPMYFGIRPRPIIDPCVSHIPCIVPRPSITKE